jgi:hypothetical protein
MTRHVPPPVRPRRAITTRLIALLSAFPCLNPRFHVSIAGASVAALFARSQGSTCTKNFSNHHARFEVPRRPAMRVGPGFMERSDEFFGRTTSE